MGVEPQRHFISTTNSRRRGRITENSTSKLEARLSDAESKADEEKSAAAETAAKLAESLALIAKLKTSQQDSEAELNAFKDSSRDFLAQ